MEFKNLLIETTDGVTTLTINRPAGAECTEQRGAAASWSAPCTNLNLDATVKAVVLTGAGEKAFVAGADIKEMSELCLI